MVRWATQGGVARYRGRDLIALAIAAAVFLPAGVAAQSPGPSPASSPPASIVGEWASTHDCQAIVAMLSGAGLDEFVLEQIWGNGLLPGATSDADIADPSDPCVGTIPQAHSHFFTEDGLFGSRDYTGQQVDDGRYVLLPDGVIEINGARFGYAIVGDSLTLMPELPDISSCADKGCRFPAAWMLMVALPGSTWTRSTALESADPSAAPA